MDIGAYIKKARKQRGLTQLQVATRAGIGVATLQNIEANRANPELSTITALFKTLRIKFKFEVEKRETDFVVLAAYGCPLMVKNADDSIRPTRAGLIEESQLVEHTGLKGREAKAVASWVHAIRDHYPSVWNQLPMALRSWAENQPVEPKLRRLALSRLGAFL